MKKEKPKEIEEELLNFSHELTEGQDELPYEFREVLDTNLKELYGDER